MGMKTTSTSTATANTRHSRTKPDAVRGTAEHQNVGVGRERNPDQADPQPEADRTAHLLPIAH